MSGESIQKIFEEEREEDDEGWINQFDNSKISNEGREEYNPDELSTVYFGTPNMFITLWFGFVYGTNPPLGTLII
jgi:hypothetical protein